MSPAFLVPESTVHSNGEGQPFELSADRPAILLVTLGITGTVEQEALLVSLHGSADGVDWSPAPLAFFPQKFYKGVSSVAVNLEAHPDIRFLRAQWKVSRWGRGDKTPSFTWYLFAESGSPVTAG
jgi:hypothetical protein